MLSKISVILTEGGATYIPQLSKVLASAFVNDPIGRYIHLSGDDLPNDAVISHERRERGFVERLTGRIVTGPHLVEAGNWAAVAVWFPPASKLPPPDRETASEIMLEYYDTFAEIKKKHLGERKYWYLNLLGRDSSRTEPGVITALISTYLQKAREEGVPAWLESTGEHSRDVYSRFGFRVVETVILLAGKADKNGFRVAGGEGIPVYAMLAEPN